VISRVLVRDEPPNLQDQKFYYALYGLEFRTVIAEYGATHKQTNKQTNKTKQNKTKQNKTTNKQHKQTNKLTN
jgi:hypothetical protein